GDSVVGGLVADVLPLAVRAPRGLLGHAPIIVCSGFAAAGPQADGVAGRAAAAWIHRTRRPPWAWKGRGRASLPGVTGRGTRQPDSSRPGTRRPTSLWPDCAGPQLTPRRA